MQFDPSWSRARRRVAAWCQPAALVIFSDMLPLGSYAVPLYSLPEVVPHQVREIHVPPLRGQLQEKPLAFLQPQVQVCRVSRFSYNKTPI